jgi:hypothetical protein
MTDEDGSDGRGAFGEKLAELNREGGNLLVTGDFPSSVHHRACRPLFGGTDGPPRRRVIAAVGERIGVDDRLLPEADRGRDHLLVVESGHLVRGGAATEEPGSTDTGDGAETDPTVLRAGERDLQVLGETVGRAIDELSRGADGFDPAELRVCVDSLASLFAEHDRGDVVAFAHVLTNRIAAERGIGHFHLPLPVDDNLVSALEPLFDVVVELRLVDGSPHQRWRTGDEDSGWIPL